MGTTGQTAGREKSGIHLTAGDHGKQTGRERDALRRDGRRWEQRPTTGRGREVAVVNKIQSGFPFPSRPVPVPTTFSRSDHYYYRAFPWLLPGSCLGIALQGDSDFQPLLRWNICTRYVLDRHNLT